MIEIKNLSKYYGDFLALDDLSFSVEKGRILGFLGPNGSGKTTTMRIITGFMPPSSGTVLIGGMDIARESLAIKKMIGYLPEIPPLYYDMKVDEYLIYVARIKDVREDIIPFRLTWAKEKCGLVEVSRKLLGTLSKGFKQRVGIAQSIINEPQVLILDEPSIGLDPRQASEIRQLIRSLAGERTVILSTHILPDVSAVCDDILIIAKGKKVFGGAISSLADKENLEKIFLEYTKEVKEET